MHYQEAPSLRDQALDDQLASFTDQVLSGDKGGQTGMNDPELANLQQTALRLHTALQAQPVLQAQPAWWIDRPDTATAARVRARARIRARLQSEWKMVREPRPSRANWHWTQFAAGGLFVLILAAAIFFLNPTTDTLTGSADGLTPWTPVFIVIGLSLIAILIWTDRRH